jgi:ABC-type Fe3+-siderophore transport system permease subunit
VWDCLLWLLAGVLCALAMAVAAYVAFVGWVMAKLDKDEW